MPDCIIAGGGLAGMAAAAALGEAGFRVQVFESRPFLGGRAASYAVPGSPEETIDNCQHILLKCCVNLLDFYRRMGVEERIRFYREFHFLEPGGRRSDLPISMLPAPAHFAPGFLKLKFLTWGERMAVARGLLAILRQRDRQDLNEITMAAWLAEQGQPPRALERFWRPVLVSAVNADPAHMAAAYGFQVFRLGFLERPEFSEMGVPSVALGELYGRERWERLPKVEIRTGLKVERFCFRGAGACAAVAGGEEHKADFYISAVPFESVAGLAPELPLDLSCFRHSPITGIHLWFDRPVTELPHAALLDRTIQWFFNKREGRYLQLVVSASNRLLQMPRQEVIEMSVSELRDFLPAVGGAVLERAHVVKEARATFTAAPGLESRRPGPRTPFENFFLAGDWTATGWPATMEGAVRSGYRAAEAVTEAAGRPMRFLVEGVR